MNCKAIILAAGDGKRMKSSGPKVMCTVLGDPMIDWVTDSVRDAGIKDEDTGVIVGYGADKVKSFLAEKGAFRTFTQAERRGTGHAVMQAAGMLGPGTDVLVLCGDAPFADSDTIKASLEEHRRSGNDVTVVTAELPDPADRGRILRGDNGELLGIVVS
ncbi:MAG: NTP transferase domain-containing protein, partial [Ruminiclostridium sp.]|nr:NTP transferase domain-containing protein [Ruminiclostridium sp.]